MPAASVSGSRHHARISGSCATSIASAAMSDPDSANVVLPPSALCSRRIAVRRIDPVDDARQDSALAAFPSDDDDKRKREHRHFQCGSFRSRGVAPRRIERAPDVTSDADGWRSGDNPFEPGAGPVQPHEKPAAKLALVLVRFLPDLRGQRALSQRVNERAGSEADAASGKMRGSLKM